jgi:hypothetical protein
MKVFLLANWFRLLIAVSCLLLSISVFIQSFVLLQDSIAYYQAEPLFGHFDWVDDGLVYFVLAVTLYPKFKVVMNKILMFFTYIGALVWTGLGKMFAWGK